MLLRTLGSKLATLTRWPARSRQASLRPVDAATTFTIEYTPRPDGRADPGEVVWTWVPYEDDPKQGKDRPVLVIGRHGRRLVGLMLTSKDHDADAAHHARFGRHWMDVGTGTWDRQRRPSEVRLDRLLDIDPKRVRREGGALPQATFDMVIAEFRRRRPDGYPSSSSG